MDRIGSSPLYKNLRMREGLARYAKYAFTFCVIPSSYALEKRERI